MKWGDIIESIPEREQLRKRVEKLAARLETLLSACGDAPHR